MNKKSLSFSQIIIGVILIAMGLLSMHVNAKIIYGLYEKVQLIDADNVSISAKLDTGALTSSLGVDHVHFFEKDGNDWIRFQPQVKGMQLPIIEKQVIRYSRIKIRTGDIANTGTEELFSQRPVVIIDICFDGKIYPMEVNLTDRSRFNYPLLLGSLALVDFKAVIDPALKFQSSHQCSAN